MEGSYIKADSTGVIEAEGSEPQLITLYTVITKFLLDEGIDKKYLEIALELADTKTEDLEKKREEIMGRVIREAFKTKLDELMEDMED